MNDGESFWDHITYIYHLMVQLGGWGMWVDGKGPLIFDNLLLWVSEVFSILAVSHKCLIMFMYYIVASCLISINLSYL